MWRNQVQQGSPTQPGGHSHAAIGAGCSVTSLSLQELIVSVEGTGLATLRGSCSVVGIFSASSFIATPARRSLKIRAA